MQTNYSLAFSVQPPAIVRPNANFAAAVQLSESGSPFPVSGVTIPIALASGTNQLLNLGSLTTDSSGVAASRQLQVKALESMDKLLATLPLTPGSPSAQLTPAVATSATSSSFSIGVAAQPVLTPGNGIYISPQMVKITDATPGAIIYYTTNGTNPGRSSAVYRGPIPVSSMTVIKAVAILAGYFASPEAAALYTFKPQAAEPILTPGSGIYIGPQRVQITDATPGAVIYYTTDGTTPGRSSTLYTGPIPINSTTILKALAFARGYLTSPEGAAVYIVIGHEVDLSWDAPSASPVPIAGYNIYRSRGGRSPYERLNSSVVTQTTYVDHTIQTGSTYSYIVKSVDYSGTESAPSNHANVGIP